MGKPTEDSTAASVGQWALLIFCVAATLVAGGATLHLNVTFGLQLGGIFAVAFGLADCFQIAMPIIANTGGGWKSWQRMIWVASVLLSVTAASSHLLEMFSNAYTATEAAGRSAADNRADRDRSRAELTRITELSTVAAIQMLIPAAKAKAADAEAEARDAGIGCSKRKACEKATAAHAALLERLGLAQRRDELKAQLAALEKAPGAEPAKSLGMGENLAKLTGTDAGQTSNAIMIGVAVLILLMLQVAVSGLAGESGRRIAAMAGGRRPPGKPAPRPQAAKIVRHAAPPIERTKKDDALLKLQMMIHHAPTGVLVAAYPTLADEFGVVKSTAQKWVGEWEAAGLIEVQSHGKAGSLFRAPRLQRTA
jgi:hypothetical protein